LPIKDLAFEHRMYLPLAAIAAVVVVAIYLVGERLARRLDETEAERTLTAELLALVLTLSAAAILGALTWRRNADYQTGTAIWQDTVNQRRDNPRAWNNLADAWINAGDYTDVLRYCDEAIRLKLNFPEPYNNRGIWYAKQGEFEEAVDNYSLAIQMRENFPMAYNNRASACIHLGRYEEAIQDCLRAVELDPELAMAYYNLGEAYSKTDDAAGAVSAYSKAIELNWNYAEAYKSRAVAHYCVKEYDKAWADAEACEKLGGRLEPDFIRALSRDSGRSR
jgi:tetratricopeptide (TPR) repeat protein